MPKHLSVSDNGKVLLFPFVSNAEHARWVQCKSVPHGGEGRRPRTWGPKPAPPATAPRARAAGPAPFSGTRIVRRGPARPGWAGPAARGPGSPEEPIPQRLAGAELRLPSGRRTDRRERTRAAGVHGATGRGKGPTGGGGDPYPANVLCCGSSWFRGSWQPPSTYMLGLDGVPHPTASKTRILASYRLHHRFFTSAGHNFHGGEVPRSRPEFPGPDPAPRRAGGRGKKKHKRVGCGG
jgi:hypothetical protein